MSKDQDTIERQEGSTIDRREAIKRVAVILGGVTFVGGSSLLTACQNRDQKVVQAGDKVGDFSTTDISMLDEIADTILPDTKTPGAKAAGVGPFMALMVTDCYYPKDQKVFRDGLQKIDDACKKANNVSFVSATPQQRLDLLTAIDKEAKTYGDAVEAARKRQSDTTKTIVEKKAEAKLPDERKEAGIGGDAGAAVAITADSPPHYFRMMKELTMLGYFTSEIGMTKAQRYAETPGKYDPCVPYKPGDKAWAPHA